MLYILESENGNQREIFAVSSDLQQLEHYRENLAASEATLTLVTINQSFPLYVVEHLEEGNDIAGAKYRYTPVGGLLALLESTDPVERNDEAIFSYYIFDSNYFRDTTFKHSWIQPVRVDNSFWRGFMEDESENYLRYQHVTTIAANYNLMALDFLYDHWVHQEDEHRRFELAEEGYAALFWTMCYDLACNKLSQEAVADFIPMIENAEALCRKKLWSLRAEGFTNLLYNAIEHEPEKIVSYGLQAIDALKNLRHESARPVLELCRLAYVYGELVTHDQPNQNIHWQNAIDCVHECIQLDAEEVPWRFYIDLVSGEIAGENEVLKKMRSEETQCFLQTAASFAENNSYHQLIIALAYRDYITHRQQENREIHPMLQVQALYWLNLAISWKGGPTTSVTTDQAISFFRDEGVRLQRMDVLEAARDLYFPAAGNVSGDTYGVARILQSIADLHIIQNNTTAANETLHQTWQYYRERWEDNDDNISYLIHFAEFLEKLYNTWYVTDKPEIRDIRYAAVRAEHVGNGHYGTPGFLLARLALLEGDEDEAIHLVTRELLLHELCIDNRITEFKKDEQFRPFHHLQEFLNATLQFMEDVSVGYFFDPCIRWEELNRMNPPEVATAWKNRMETIRNRKKLS